MFNPNNNVSLERLKSFWDQMDTFDIRCEILGGWAMVGFGDDGRLTVILLANPLAHLWHLDGLNNGNFCLRILP